MLTSINQHLKVFWSTSFYKRDALSVTQPTASKHWRHDKTFIAEISTSTKEETQYNNDDDDDDYAAAAAAITTHNTTINFCLTGQFFCTHSAFAGSYKTELLRFVGTGLLQSKVFLSPN